MTAARNMNLQRQSAHPLFHLCCLALLAAQAGAAGAQTSVPAIMPAGTSAMITSAERRLATDTYVVRVAFLNLRDAAAAITIPATLAIAIRQGSAARAMAMQLAPGNADPVALPANGAIVRDYLLDGAAAFPAAGEAEINLADNPALAVRVGAGAPVAVAAQTSAEPASAARPNAREANYFASFSAYQPIYAVFGQGTNTAARVQISFKYQLFGKGSAFGGGASWLDGFHIGYTQKMFADLTRQSSPFRNVDYAPEIFYASRPLALSGRLGLSGQIALLHESNGRDGAASRSYNQVYVQPTIAWQMGRYTARIGPRAWVFVGSNSDNPQIQRFRGNTGLFAEIGDANGFQLTGRSRLNLGSGKGSGELELSHPLGPLIGRDVNLLLFVQAFTGFGETLLDYDVRVQRLRFGIGIVR